MKQKTVGTSGAKLAPLSEITEEHYEALFSSNVKGVLFTVQKACGWQDGASIILNASIAASTAPLPGWSVYNATKAAVPFVRAVVDNGLEGSPHSRERSERRLYGYAAMAFPRNQPRKSLRRFRRVFRSVGSAPPMRLRALWYFSHRMTAATSRERNCCRRRIRAGVAR